MSSIQKEVNTKIDIIENISNEELLDNKSDKKEIKDVNSKIDIQVTKNISNKTTKDSKDEYKESRKDFYERLKEYRIEMASSVCNQVP